MGLTQEFQTSTTVFRFEKTNYLSFKTSSIAPYIHTRRGFRVKYNQYDNKV